MTAFPSPGFSPWYPWSALEANTPADLGAMLQQVGCYLLARFDIAPPTGAATPDQPEIFYVGETHGRTTSLSGRLTAFGNSAGFYGGQWNGHYAAWGFPRLFPQDVSGPGRDGAGSACSPARVHVALCPWPSGLPQHLRGLFPTAVEQRALWAYATARGDLPALNNSGRTRLASIPTQPTITNGEVEALLDHAAFPQQGKEAALAVTQRLALGLGYSTSRQATIVRYGRWEGAVRRLGNDYLYIGWYDSRPGGVTLSVYRKTRCLHDGGSAPAHEAVLEQVATFWDNWASP